MPIFEFECPECGNREELILLGHEESYHLACRKCGELMKKVPSAPAIAKLKEPL